MFRVKVLSILLFTDIICHDSHCAVATKFNKFHYCGVLLGVIREHNWLKYESDGEWKGRCESVSVQPDKRRLKLKALSMQGIPVQITAIVTEEKDIVWKTAPLMCDTFPWWRFRALNAIGNNMRKLHRTYWWAKSTETVLQAEFEIFLFVP